MMTISGGPEMREQLFERLNPVKRRQKLMNVIHAASLGLAVGGALACIAAVLRRLSVISVPEVTPVACVALGLLVGSCWGAIRRTSWHNAASAIDVHYGLKDRASSALDFVSGGTSSTVHCLQQSDALRHLDVVSPKEVIPILTPKTVPVAIFTLMLATTLTLAPVRDTSVRAENVKPLRHITEEAEVIEEDILEQIKELLAENPEGEQLKELAVEVKGLLNEMKEPGVDTRQAIAKISEMQAAIAALKAEYNVEAMDASMDAIGEAIAAATSLRKAGESLQSQDYDKAGGKLEQFDPDNLTKREAQALQENLSKLAKQLNENSGKHEELSQALSQMSDGLKNGNEDASKDGADKLAALSRKQGLRKKISKSLGSQLAALSECKGNCSGKGNTQGGKSIAKTKSPSTKWGQGASGKPLGDESTNLNSNRNRQEITGAAGEGPSEKEVMHSPEGRQTATRNYSKSYQKFKKMTEAVLDSEPLPLGHRRTIRTYFEGIRPQNAELDSIVESEQRDSAD